MWKLTERVVTNGNGESTTSAQPGLLIFTRSHYSMMLVPGANPRALFKAPDPTDEERAAACNSVQANTGTYEITSTTLTIRPVVAKSPNYMGGGFNKYHFQVEGNALTLTSKSKDLHSRLQDKVVPDSGPITETRMKLVRLE